MEEIKDGAIVIVCLLAVVSFILIVIEYRKSNKIRRLGIKRMEEKRRRTK